MAYTELVPMGILPATTPPRQRPISDPTQRHHVFATMDDCLHVLGHIGAIWNVEGDKFSTRDLNFLGEGIAKKNIRKVPFVSLAFHEADLLYPFR